MKDKQREGKGMKADLLAGQKTRQNVDKRDGDYEGRDGE